MGNDNDSNNDNDNENVISIFSKINDAGSGAATGFSKAGGSMRFFHKGSVNLKYYGSGWGGGSKAKIKTYKSAKIGGTLSKIANGVGLAFSLYNMYDAYKEDGNKLGKNCKKTACSEAGSWVGATAGSTAGAAIGSAYAPGIGTIIGGIIGGVAGGIGGEKGGESIGNAIYDE